MQILLNLISGKKSKYVLVVFCIFYALILGLIWVLKVDPMIKETELLENNIQTADSNFKSYVKALENKKKEEIDIKNSINLKIGLFHNDQEIEKFYEEISNLTISHGMVMKSLVRGNTEPMNMTDNDQSVDSNIKNNNVMEQLKVGVSYEVEGSFKDYLLMRKILANMEKIIIYEEEIINRSQDKKNTITARGNISIPKVSFKVSDND